MVFLQQFKLINYRLSFWRESRSEDLALFLFGFCFCCFFLYITFGHMCMCLFVWFPFSLPKPTSFLLPFLMFGSIFLGAIFFFLVDSFEQAKSKETTQNKWISSRFCALCIGFLFRCCYFSDGQLDIWYPLLL